MIIFCWSIYSKFDDIGSFRNSKIGAPVPDCLGTLRLPPPIITIDTYLYCTGGMRTLWQDKKSAVTYCSLFIALLIYNTVIVTVIWRSSLLHDGSASSLGNFVRAAGSYMKHVPPLASRFVQLGRWFNNKERSLRDEFNISEVYTLREFRYYT